VSLLGLALRAWAAGHIRKNAQLATSGPYAFTRNPLYLGSFLLGLGFTIASGRLLLGVLFAALFLGIYLPVMRVEASHMAELFGSEFETYRRSVPLFFPRIRPFPCSFLDLHPFAKTSRLETDSMVRFIFVTANIGPRSASLSPGGCC
jgi:hypothetical protein